MRQETADPKGRKKKAVGTEKQKLSLLQTLQDMLEMDDAPDRLEIEEGERQVRHFSGSVIYPGFISAVYGGRMQLGLKRTKR